MDELYKIIPDNPEDRLRYQLKEKLKSGDFIFDVHTHIFNAEFLPKKYFSLRLPYIVDTEFLIYVNENLQEDMIGEDKLLYFIKYFKFLQKNSTEKIAEHLLSNTPRNMIFFSLSMDFTGIEPKPEKSYALQVEKIKQIADTYPDRFIPFFSINPKNISNPLMLPRVFSEKYRFFGVSLYPSLGFMPSHPTLMNLYEIFESKKVPIITNSSYSNVHTTKNLQKVIYWEYDCEEDKFKLKKQTKIFWFKNQFITFFNNPKNWENVLKKYPNLYLCFAHSGGWEAWIEKSKSAWLYSILDLMERYPNVYADISYLIALEGFTQKFLDLFHKNKVFADRVLFGTDYHFVMIEGHYNTIRTKFINAVGSEVMHKIARVNPLKFLSLEKYI